MAEVGQRIVLLAFNRDQDGHFAVALQSELLSEAAAVTAAKLARRNYAGVIAFVRRTDRRDARPTILFQEGDVLDVK